PQDQFRSNSFGLCRYTTPSSNSFAFYRSDLPSHLHIPQQLKVTRLHGFAKKSHLTPAVSAHPRLPGRALPGLLTLNGRPSTDNRKTISSVFSRLCTPQIRCPVFSYDYTLPKFDVLYFQAITHSGEGGYPHRYRPGASPTDWTGSIPDTVSRMQVGRPSFEFRPPRRTSFASLPLAPRHTPA